ncbi:MAG TPA: aminotransferase class I/II-fold pyridoxal phosphate-dependent enzyme [Patescibacteria group bacterium]|nr:aminotransferase class I/II-fold pyridoxal phosphate-dependent enzyme [Patescibacteria group bacterium]
MKKHLSEYLDLTQHQLHALTQEYNLADAHTHQSQSPSQRKIVARLPKLWYGAEKLKQKELEDKFVETFFTFHKQYKAIKTPSLLVYAASIAMAIFANYFKKNKLSVSLLTPCFDNLHDLLLHHQVPLKPLKEEWLHRPDTIYNNLKKHVKTDVLFIVSPNNPTGFELMGQGDQNKIRYHEIVRYAKDHKKILAFDFCFYSFVLPDVSVSSLATLDDKGHFVGDNYKCRGNYIFGLSGTLSRAINDHVISDSELIAKIQQFKSHDFRYVHGERTAPEEITMINALLADVIQYLEKLTQKE